MEKYLSFYGLIARVYRDLSIFTIVNVQRLGFTTVNSQGLDLIIIDVERLGLSIVNTERFDLITVNAWRLDLTVINVERLGLATVEIRFLFIVNVKRLLYDRIEGFSVVDTFLLQRYETIKNLLFRSRVNVVGTQFTQLSSTVESTILYTFLSDFALP